MPVNVTSTLSNNRSPRAYGSGGQGYGFTRSHTSFNLFQDPPVRSGGGGIQTSMSSAFLAQGVPGKPLSKSPSSSFLREKTLSKSPSSSFLREKTLSKSPSSSYLRETPRNAGISRPTSLLFEPSVPTSKAITPTKPLYSPIAGNTKNIVSALNSLGRGEKSSDLQAILGKKSKFSEESKKKDPLYIPRHGGVSSYARVYLDKTKQTHVEWPKRQNKPREIDTRDINLNKDKPPAPLAKSGATSGTPYRDNSVTRNRSVVRITSRRKKSVKDNAPKTIGQKLMEKYVERDKDETKQDPTEFTPRNRRVIDTSYSNSQSDKLSKDLNLPGPNTNVPFLQSQASEIPKQFRDIEIKPPADDMSSSNSDSDEQDDTFVRLQRATESAANRKSLEYTQDVKDAIIAAILHPDVDIESDEEMQNLIRDDSRSSDSSKGSVNMSIKRQSGKRKSTDKLENIVENSIEQNNNFIGGKAEGEAIVGQLKRFVKQQQSMKRSSRKSSLVPLETNNQSEDEKPNQQNQNLINSNHITGNHLTSNNNKDNSQCERNISLIPPYSMSNEVVNTEKSNIPQITLKYPSSNELNLDSLNLGDDKQKSQEQEKHHEQSREKCKMDFARSIIESKLANTMPTAETIGEKTEVSIGLPPPVIKPLGKKCGVSWEELAPGAPDIPVEPKWPPKQKAQKVPVKTNNKLLNGAAQTNIKSPETEPEKNLNVEKKAAKRPRQIFPPPKKEDKLTANILEARKILKRPVKGKEMQKDTTEDAAEIDPMGKKVLRKPIPLKEEDGVSSLQTQLKAMKMDLKATSGLAEDGKNKIVIKKFVKKDRSSSSSNDDSRTKKNGKGKCKKSPSGDKSNKEGGVSLQVIGSKDTLSQSADSGYGSSPSTPQPTACQTDVINEEEICNMCGTNCHKKCEKQMPNLCGVNQKLLAEALSSVKKGSGGGQDSGVTPTPGGKLGSLSDENDDDTETESDTADYFGSPEIRSPLQSRPKFKKYSLDDFNFVKVLGKGSYGKVMLAEQKGSENYFAIKCLKKDVVLEDNDVECTLIERKVLTLGTKHPYLCHLFCSFQTPSHLFFVMEYLTGGDLMFHIQHCGRFDEYRACFYAAEITSGLKFLHNKGIIYRDLKLDNILLDYQGHIRIADFGMCKLQIYLDRFADTFCGTPDYMAPEVIKGLHYNQCVDWWSFGVLLYEMLTGKSPFKGCDEDHLFWLICHDEPFYPKFLSREATDILKQLLDKDSSRRLGVTFSPYGEIKDHPFFHYIDWQKIERKEVETPYKPRLRHLRDVQYFDPQFTKRRANVTPLEESILSELDQTAFKDFSYTNPNIPDINERPTWSKYQTRHIL